MEPRYVTLKNGLEILLKPGHIDQFIPGDPVPDGVTISVHCGWDFAKGVSHFPDGAPLFAAWHRAHARAMGIDYSMILAWEGQNIVGVLSFYAAVNDKPALKLPMWFDKCCPYEKQSEDEARSVSSLDIRKHDYDTIKLTCAKSVALNLKRQGLLTAMLEYLIDIAKENGWKHINAVGYVPETPDDFWPPLAALERLGFRRVGQRLELDGTRVYGYAAQLDI